MSAPRFGTYAMHVPPLEDCVEAAVACEQIGFDTLAFTDQMVGNLPRQMSRSQDSDGRGQPGMFDPTVLMTLASQRTRDIELYLGAIDAVRHAPSKLAQTFYTLDHATQGRSWFALGASEAKNVLPYGHPRIGSMKKLEDSLAIVRLLLDHPGEPVHYAGEKYSMKGGYLEYVPYGDRPPLVLAATGGTPETLALCGRYGDGLMTNLPGMCHGGPEQFAKEREIIREAAERAGRDPDALRFAASVLVVMHEDPAEVDRLCTTFDVRWNTIVYGAVYGSEWRKFGFEHPLGDEWNYARHMVPACMTPEQVRTAADAVPLEAVKMGHFAGSPDEIAAKLGPFIEAGLEYLILVDYAPLADPSLGATSTANQDRLVRRLGGKGLKSRRSIGFLGTGRRLDDS